MRPRPQPNQGYQYPSGPAQGSPYGPNSQSGAYPDLGDDEYDDNEYDDYDYGMSPISYSSEDYGRRSQSPDQQYPSSFDQRGQMEFECNNLAQCVPSSQMCDGEFGGNDGSDESNCGGRG